MKTLRFIALGGLLIISGSIFGQTAEPGQTDAGANAAKEETPDLKSLPMPQYDESYNKVEFGIRFMPVFSTFNVRTVDNGVVRGSFTLGYGFGGLIGVNFSPNVGIEADVIYNALTQKYRDRSLDRTLHLNYINVPLMLSVNTGKDRMVNLNIVAGPQVGFNVGSRIESEGSNGVDTVQAVLAVKRGDLGVAYGAGLEFMLGESHRVHFDIGFRGVYGLIDISDRSKSITTNEYYILDRAHVQTYAAYAGLTFGF